MILTNTGSFSLVTNAIFAPLINKEPFRLRDAIAIFFIVAGSVLVVLYSDRTERKYSLCALLQLYSKGPIIATIAVVVFFLIVIYIFIKFIEANHDPESRPIGSHSRHPSMIVVTNGSLVEDAISPTDETAAIIVLDSPSRSFLGRWFPSFEEKFLRLFQIGGWMIPNDSFFVKWLLPFSYASLGAIMGSFTTLFAKSVVELLNLTISGDDQFKLVMSYVLVACLLFTSILQVSYT